MGITVVASHSKMPKRGVKKLSLQSTIYSPESLQWFSFPVSFTNSCNCTTEKAASCGGKTQKNKCSSRQKDRRGAA